MNINDVWPIVAATISGVSLLVTMLLSYIIKAVVTALRDLKSDHDAVQKDVAEVKLMLVGKFLTKEEADRELAMLLLEHKALELRVRATELALVPRHQ